MSWNADKRSTVQTAIGVYNRLLSWKTFSNMEIVVRIIVQAVCIAILTTTTALAGPAEEANAAVDRWVAAYSANDVEALTKVYAPDAILLGTTSPVISENTGGIREYFKDMPGSGRKNVITERRTIVLGEDSVLATGFYEFFRPEQKDTPRPSRFTMVLVKRDGQWVIVHHHSSPRAAVRQ